MLIIDICKYIDIKKGVVHVGAHEGEEREWYKNNGFSPVLWFEPNPDAFVKLNKNVSNIESNWAVNKGIYDTNCKSNLHIANNGQSSSLLDLGTHAKHHPDVKYIKDVEVDCMRLDEFFSGNNFSIKDFNFLNIDVQGTELNVIKSLGGYINFIDYIYTEINTEKVYKECCLVSEIDAYLSIFGFVRLTTKMTKANWGDAFYKKY